MGLALRAFVTAHPENPWDARLVNAGLWERQTGWFSRALQDRAEAWRLSRGATDPRGLTLAERAGTELAEFSSRLGRKEFLAAFFDETASRAFHGSALDDSVLRTTDASTANPAPAVVAWAFDPVYPRPRGRATTRRDG